MILRRGGVFSLSEKSIFRGRNFMVSTTYFEICRIKIYLNYSNRIQIKLRNSCVINYFKGAGGGFPKSTPPCRTPPIYIHIFILYLKISYKLRIPFKVFLVCYLIFNYIIKYLFLFLSKREK